MTDEDNDKEEGSEKPRSAAPASTKGTAENPAWANGLKQLYDSVVDEPLPDSFNDLLAQFEDDDDDAPEGDATA